jgi:hypothetical protein
VSETATPPHIRAHGYDKYKRKGGVPVRCSGSEYPPLEFDSTQAETTLRYHRSQLADLIERKRGMEDGSLAPEGLTGVAAMKVRFLGAKQIEADQRRRDVVLAQIRIDACQREIDNLTRLLVTRIADPTLTVQHLRQRVPRIGDLFRKTSDGALYCVDSVIPAPPIARHGSRRPVKAPHYMCRRVSDGTLHRFLQTAVTRALNEQCGTLTPHGRPPEPKGEEGRA